MLLKKETSFLSLVVLFTHVSCSLTERSFINIYKLDVKFFPSIFKYIQYILVGRSCA